MLTLQNVKLEISEYSNTTKIILSNTLSFFWKKKRTPNLRFSESWFSEILGLMNKSQLSVIVFYTIHCLGLVKFSV